MSGTERERKTDRQREREREYKEKMLLLENMKEYFSVCVRKG